MRIYDEISVCYDSSDAGLSEHNVLIGKAILRSSDNMTLLIALLGHYYDKREKPSFSVRTSELLGKTLGKRRFRMTDSSDSVRTSRRGCRG